MIRVGELGVNWLGMDPCLLRESIVGNSAECVAPPAVVLEDNRI